MKKIFCCLFLMLAICSCSYATDNQYYDIKTTTKKQTVKRCQCKKYFQEHLGLTTEQILLIDSNRKAQEKELKPVNAEIRANYKKIKEIEKSNLSKEIQDKKIVKIRKEIVNLKNKSAQIKTEHNAKFESYLTQEQLKTLEEMRELRKQGKSCCPCGKNRYY